MSNMNLQDDIRPITDLKRSASALVDQVNESRRPVVLTRHGRGVAVLVSVDEYELLRERAERAAFNTAVADADADIAAGRTLGHEELARKHRAKYGGQDA
jgi:antitoxin YefM